LRQEGHQVWYVVEMEPGIADEEVLALANREGAILITADKDFGELVFRLRYSTSGSYEVQLLTPHPSPLIPFTANNVPHNCCKCCISLPELF
jgi:hypothetical protein